MDECCGVVMWRGGFESVVRSGSEGIVGLGRGLSGRMGIDGKEVRKYPYYLANKAVYANEDLKVEDKATRDTFAVCALADSDVVDKGIEAAEKAAKEMGKMPSYQRKRVLERAVEEMKVRSEELALALCAEAGKPIKDSRGEVSRLIETFTIAAEESVRMYGEYVPLDISARVDGKEGACK